MKRIQFLSEAKSRFIGIPSAIALFLRSLRTRATCLVPRDSRNVCLANIAEGTHDMTARRLRRMGPHLRPQRRGLPSVCRPWNEIPQRTPLLDRTRRPLHPPTLQPHQRYFPRTTPAAHGSFDRGQLRERSQMWDARFEFDVADLCMKHLHKLKMSGVLEIEDRGEAVKKIRDTMFGQYTKDQLEAAALSVS